MESMMWAVRKERAAPGLDLVEVPLPAVGDDEVLVRVEAASICGTDLHIFRWDDWAQRRIRPPLVLGHEFAGTIVETGKLVRLWQNDRTKLPPEIATLQEPFGNAVFALGHADLAGRTVAVLGCGPVGLFSIGIARSSSGAGRILASDASPFRLDLAKQMGAHAVVDVSRVAAAAPALVELNEGQHLDVVFEMSGAPDAIATAFEIVRHGGRVILFGIPARPVELDVAEALIFKNLDVSAVSGRQIWDTWYRTQWLLEHGVVDLRPLITAECGLDEFEHAFELLGSGDACKIVLHPQPAAVEAAA
jgi:threonine 3-dehydrogenase